MFPKHDDDAVPFLSLGRGPRHPQESNPEVIREVSAVLRREDLSRRVGIRVTRTGAENSRRREKVAENGGKEERENTRRKRTLGIFPASFRATCGGP